MTRGQLRRLHTSLLPPLLVEMQRQGFSPALDEGFVGRSVDKPEEDSPHRRDGGHFKGLAQDVLLYQCRHRPAHTLLGCPDPEYIRDSEPYRPFGVFWMALHPLCRWSEHDGNHYGLLDAGVFVA